MSHRIDVARQIIRECETAQAEYLAECERSYREGFTPHYCIHGVNQWVDYDCACWACERGEFTAYTPRSELIPYALIMADYRIAQERDTRSRANANFWAAVNIYRSFDEWADGSVRVDVVKSLIAQRFAERHAA